MPTEADTRANIIDPMLREIGWIDSKDIRVFREFPINQGRINPDGTRAAPLKADYVLVHKNIKLAVIEAKSENRSYTDAVSQSKKYASLLNIRFAYATDGKNISQIDMQTKKSIMIKKYPTPNELLDMTYKKDNEIFNKLTKVPYINQFTIRYYQENAVNAVINALSEKRNRILLTLATGTGKTLIACEIANKLIKARWTKKDIGITTPRILFLADRNILADQANNTFLQINSKGGVIRLEASNIKKDADIPMSAHVYITIFQTMKSSNLYKKYTKDFFDFIIIDECHRGGANDESEWRDILDHFQSAVHLGLTATPKAKDNANTYAYFGNPVYVYSLKEGINDGYLTPFRVRQITDNFETYKYDPSDDIDGENFDEDKVYKQSDYNTIIQIKEKEEKRVKYFLNEINKYDKTIVFCANIEHAGIIRDIINNELPSSSNDSFCERVTAADGNDGEIILRTFQYNEKELPSILTTSQKLSTGVDAAQIKNIVLLRSVNNIIEFKQIIGRGTRLYYKKNYFVVYDFVNASKNFEDPQWDGETIFISENAHNIKNINDKTNIAEDSDNEDDTEHKKKELIKITLGDGRKVELYDNGTLFYDKNSQKIISSYEFIKTFLGIIPNFFESEQELRKIWKAPSTREELLKRFEEKGYTLDNEFKKMQELLNAENSDIFDVIEYIAGYNKKLITREERADKCLEKIKDQYEERQLAFIEFVLNEYKYNGIKELYLQKIGDLLIFKYGTIQDAAKTINMNLEDIKNLFYNFQNNLYNID
ncbi:EcoAI/FtnUII family type I restriction enzme subunit R [Brachyspira hampsonii]|uniref:EcoAI/FtnUII family type I restriction enzme subunit R n=1 Tax=Brachyspira hampsonii TaxID=1287055 RepID=UPI001CA581C9|nr:DEAD/DEAH box helicase family protein [Brachyspira hampsonii]MBW5388685.1 DEAD/DEAH box helicase [Brachyspira hampsonii]